MRLPSILLVVLLGAALLTGVATARTAAVPQNTTPPSIGGTAREGNPLTARNGTWTNSPTSFAYQWQRCASDGTGCGDINAATDKTYTPTSGDVSHALRVVVTATNADGKASASSEPSAIVDSKNGPDNTVKPTVTGTAVVGEQLRVSNGSWSPNPTSFSGQWPGCKPAGNACRDISGASGAPYGVRSADVGHRLRALVTARSSGGTATAASNARGEGEGKTTTATTP